MTVVSVAAGVVVVGVTLLVFGVKYVTDRSSTSANPPAAARPTAPSPTPATPPVAQGSQPERPWSGAQPATPPARPPTGSPPPSPAPVPAVQPPALSPGGTGMQVYRDPQQSFTIEHPRGWQVLARANGVTTFYLDDPEEGISVSVSPRTTIPGELRGADLVKVFVDRTRQRYPDFKWTPQPARPAAPGIAASDRVEGAATWTNRKGQRMLARGVVLSAPRGGQTAYVYVGGQAPEFVFPGLEPILLQMLDTFRPAPLG